MILIGESIHIISGRVSRAIKEIIFRYSLIWKRAPYNWQLWSIAHEFGHIASVLDDIRRGINPLIPWLSILFSEAEANEYAIMWGFELPLPLVEASLRFDRKDP